eukprot:g26310.t1
MTFWQFGPEKERRRVDCYAGKAFFDFLTDEKEGLLSRLPEIHPIAAVYLLQTLLESRNVIASLFQEASGCLGQTTCSCRLHGAPFGASPRVLVPQVITDIVVAFASAKIVDEDLFEALMLRAVFFNDVSIYVVAALQSPNTKLVDWFVGNPTLTLPSMANIFVKARLFQSDFFSTLKMLERRKRQPPERRRGAMGRAVVEPQAAISTLSRREKARQQRARLAAMSEEEVAKEVPITPKELHPIPKHC